MAVAPKTQVSDDTAKIIYEAPYLSFVEARNKNPTVLRNVRARLLNADLSPLTIDGDAYMTLIII